GVPAAGRPRVLAFWEGGHVTCDLPPNGQLVVGRTVGSEIWIDHPSVSRKHAVIHAGNPPRIEDLGGANGTFVGGVRIAPGAQVELRPGLVIEVGVVRIVLEGPIT